MAGNFGGTYVESGTGSTLYAGTLVAPAAKGSPLYSMAGFCDFLTGRCRRPQPGKSPSLVQPFSFSDRL